MISCPVQETPVNSKTQLYFFMQIASNLGLVARGLVVFI